MVDNFSLFRLCLSAFICSHYVWLWVFRMSCVSCLRPILFVQRVATNDQWWSTVLQLMLAAVLSTVVSCFLVLFSVVCCVLVLCSMLSSVQSCSWWSIAVLCLICPWQSLHLPAAVISVIVGKSVNNKICLEIAWNTIKRMFDHPLRLQGVYSSITFIIFHN